MKKGAATVCNGAVAAPTEAPDVTPVPPIFPLQRESRQAVLDAIGGSGEAAKQPCVIPGAGG
jgi:hypothetical protein